MISSTTSTTGAPSGNNSQTTGAPKPSRFKKSGGGAGQGLPQMDFPPEDWRPCFCCYDQPFLVDARRYKAGVYHHYMKEVTDQATGEKTLVPVNEWICSVLRVLHIVETGIGDEHGYLLEYLSHGKAQPKRIVLSQELLLGRGKKRSKCCVKKASAYCGGTKETS